MTEKTNEAPFTSQDHSRSSELMSEAREYSPGGVHSSIRNLPQETFFTKAQGAYLWDADGNRYIDYNAAFAAIILGHAHPKINQAVYEALQEIDIVGLGTTKYEVEVSRKIVEHIPSADLALLCNTGSEATYHAVRVSRAHTKRMKLAKFQGCYHGWHDYLLMNVYSPPELIGHKHPLSAGMLPEAIENTTVLDFNDLQAVESTLRTGEYAALILEPIPHNIGAVLPTGEFLRGLRRICDETGTVLIFDEVITGFRHGLGGVQAIFGVTPDLTTMGKAMANGYPCAAIAGKREIMMLFATTGGPVYFAGTHNGHTLGNAASLATIAELEDGRVYQHLFALGDYIREGFSEIASRLGIPMYVSGYGSIFAPYFLDPDLGPPRNYTDLLKSDMQKDEAFRRALVARGVFFYPRPLRRVCLTAAHTREDVDQTLSVAEDVLRDLR